MRGCFVPGAGETDSAYLRNHVEETRMRQKGMKDGREQKGLTKGESPQARPERKAEGEHRSRSGQAGLTASGN